MSASKNGRAIAIGKRARGADYRMEVKDSFRVPAFVRRT